MTLELCKNSIRTREEEITGDHQRTATADCLLSITRPPVVAPGMYGKTSHVTTGHRSVVPLFKLSYPQMVTNLRSDL